MMFKGFHVPTIFHATTTAWPHSVIADVCCQRVSSKQSLTIYLRTVRLAAQQDLKQKMPDATGCKGLDVRKACLTQVMAMPQSQNNPVSRFVLRLGILWPGVARSST